MPLITQSDPGTENNGIANAHTVLRHAQDPSLKDSLQHRYMAGHMNVKPEVFWSQFRRRFTPGFEDLLDRGVHSGLYDPSNVLEKYVGVPDLFLSALLTESWVRLIFQWLFIPFLQLKMDKWKDVYNTGKKRADKNSILPHGVPQLIFESPELFDSLDFKVSLFSLAASKSSPCLIMGISPF